MDDILIQVIKDCYNEVLGREPDFTGIHTYLRHLKQGKTRDWLTSILKTSEEYQTKSLSLPSEEVQTISFKPCRKARSRIEEEITQKPETNKETNEETQIQNKKEVINIFMCVRDNEEDLSYTLSKFKKLERKHKEYDFYYYILENDSKDDTPHMVIDFFSYSKGKYRIEKSEKKKWGAVVDNQRIHDMANYRNMMLELCNSWEDSTYSFVVDTEITFDDDIIENMIHLAEKYKEYVMITPFGAVENSLKYYDTYAFHGIDMKPGVFPYSSSSSVLEVQSAFAGFALIRSDALRQSKWGVLEDVKVSEHNYLCKQLQKHGKIMCAKNIIVRWKK